MLGDMAAETLLIALADKLPEDRAETPSDTMNDIGAGVLVQRLLGTVAEARGETLQDLLGDGINA